MAGELTASEIADVKIRKRQVRERYALGTEQQDYLKQIATREAGRGQNDLVTQYGRMRDKIGFQYGKRGLLNSGVYIKDLTNRATDFSNAVAQNQGRLSDTLQGYDLAKQQLGSVQAGGLADLSELETARISTVAAMLRQAGVG